MSAIIATAYGQRKYHDAIGAFDGILEQYSDALDLPSNVRTNLSDDLLPYLKAIQISGYESNKRRKVFVIGNTGKGPSYLFSSRDEFRKLSINYL